MFCYSRMQKRHIISVLYTLSELFGILDHLQHERTYQLTEGEVDVDVPQMWIVARFGRQGCLDHDVAMRQDHESY